LSKRPSGANTPETKLARLNPGRAGRLLNDLVYEQLGAPILLAGSTLDEIGRRFDCDVLGAGPVAPWRHASSGARDAWLGDRGAPSTCPAG
jgi:hypothetical protein